MMVDSYHGLYARCVSAWGAPAQITQAAEECLELALACHHYLRDGRFKDKEEITEEIADVELMIGQLKYMLSIAERDVACWKSAKEERLHCMLNAEERKNV